MPDGLPAEPVRVDCFLLADGAQESGGKLYVLGGGWNILRPSGPDVAVPSISLAIRVVVPWNETNRSLPFELRLEDPDGNPLFGDPVVIELNVGRPPGLPPGTEQAAPFAFNLNNLVFQREGGYAFTLSLDGEEKARTRFLVEFTGRRPGPPP